MSEENKIPFQKEFEDLMKSNPELLGGNDLGIQTTYYGVPLEVPEYSSSYVRFVYEEFAKFMKVITYKQGKK